MRKVRFRYDGWAYQAYLQNLQNEGWTSEPESVGRCEVIAGAISHMRRQAWKNIEVIVMFSFLGSIICLLLYMLGTIIVDATSSYLQQIAEGKDSGMVIVKMGIATVTTLGIMAITMGIFFCAGWIVVKVFPKILSLKIIRNMEEAMEETFDLIRAMVHQKLEGTFLCPLVEVIDRPGK